MEDNTEISLRIVTIELNHRLRAKDETTVLQTTAFIGVCMYLCSSLKWGTNPWSSALNNSDVVTPKRKDRQCASTVPQTQPLTERARASESVANPLNDRRYEALTVAAADCSVRPNIPQTLTGWRQCYVASLRCFDVLLTSLNTGTRTRHWRNVILTLKCIYITMPKDPRVNKHAALLEELRS